MSETTTAHLGEVHPGPGGTVEVVQAIAAIMSELPAIGKADRSPEGYQYRGIEAITQHLQGLLAEHGVVMVPRGEILTTVPSPAMKDGWTDVTMRVDWLVVGRDGSYLTAVTNGIGRDKSDKGSNKAQTQAYKYLLLPLFCIADAKDESDGHSYEHGRREGESAARPLETFVAPNGETIEVWPGEVSTMAAKARLVEVAEGDKDAASAAWKAAGLGGYKVTDAELDEAIRRVRDTQQGAGVDGPASGGDAGARADEPGETGDGAHGQDVGRTEPEPAPDTDDTPAAFTAQVLAIHAQKVFTAAGNAAPKGQKTKVIDRLRHGLVYAFTDGKARSFNDLTESQCSMLHDLLVDLDHDRVTFDHDDTGVEFQWQDGSHTSVLWDELEPESEAVPS